MITDDVKMTGKLTIILRGPDGKIKEERAIPNLVVSTGKALIASRLRDASAAVPSHMGVGTNNAGIDVANTTMGAEVAPASTNRMALTSTTISANELTYTASFAPGIGSGALVEAGIFNAATAGTMLCRTTFAVVTKDVLDSLTIVWKLTIN